MKEGTTEGRVWYHHRVMLVLVLSVTVHASWAVRVMA